MKEANNLVIDRLNSYLIENVDTKFIRVTEDLTKFCQTNHLDLESMLDVLNGHREQYRGLSITRRLQIRSQSHIERMKQLL